MLALTAMTTGCNGASRHTDQAAAAKRATTRLECDRILALINAAIATRGTGTVTMHDVEVATDRMKRSDGDQAMMTRCVGSARSL